MCGGETSRPGECGAVTSQRAGIRGTNPLQQAANHNAAGLEQICDLCFRGVKAVSIAWAQSSRQTRASARQPACFLAAFALTVRVEVGRLVQAHDATPVYTCPPLPHSKMSTILAIKSENITIHTPVQLKTGFQALGGSRGRQHQP